MEFDVRVKEAPFEKLGVKVSQVGARIQSFDSGETRIRVAGALSSDDAVAHTFVVAANFCNREGSIICSTSEWSHELHTMFLGYETFDLYCRIDTIVPFDLSYIEVFPKLQEKRD